jgi:hypothetical protein
MANEITIQYALPDPPAQARKAWKDSPPEWLRKAKFELVDETYDGLVYRGSNASSRFGRLFAGGTYTLSLQFDSDGRFGSKVTLTGQAPPDMAAAIQADAGAHGGGINPDVGVQLGM